MRILATGIIAVLLMLGGPDPRPASAQALRAPVDSIDVRPIVTSVSFRGNEPFSRLQLGIRVRTHANREFLGIPGARWWHWLYRVGASGKLGSRLSRAFMASGEPPAYLDSTVISADVERLKLFYEQEGFRKAQITARVALSSDREKAHVTFEIERGEPTFVRFVSYDGLDALTAEEQRNVVAGSLIRESDLIADDRDRYRAQSQRFSAPMLVEERRRILTYLREEGFAAVTRDSIRAIVYQARPDSFDVVFRVRPGQRYRFGDVVANVTGPERGSEVRTDTLSDVSEAGSVVVHIQDESKLDPKLIERAMRFEPGEWYQQSRVLETKRRLDATGVFSFSNVTPEAPDTLSLDTTRVPTLAHTFDLRTRRRHRIRLEGFMLQRSGALGVLSGSESELGTGIGVTYENNNWLGGGETFQIRSTGSIAGDFVSDTTLSAQAEISTSLGYPYLIAPFRGLDRLFDLYDARTRITLSLLTARRDELKLIIRGRGAARLRLEMFHSPTIVSFVDVPDVSLSNPDTLSGFRSVFLDRIIQRQNSGLDPVQRAKILEDYTQPQVNTAFRYTFRSARVNPLRRDNGYSYEASLEIGGNLPHLLDRYVYTPGTIEGTLPGLPIFGSNRQSNRLVYRQYVRGLADVRRYAPLNRNTVLAWKGVLGAAQPTGRADVIPFDRRFYAGGATSVRGWGLRELGPGTASFRASTDSTEGLATNLLGGDIKLEGGVELRHTVIHNLLAADWIGVGFVDAGNVWFGPRNPGGPEGRFRFDSFFREIGVGSGMGIRLAWEYLIVRLDFATKVYDPNRPKEGLFPDGPRTVVHFGIGHAF